MAVASDIVAVAAPFIVKPSDAWDGDDGLWSTFDIQLGTPPQGFRVLPAVAGEQLWIPITEGCAGILSGVSNCGDLRGAQDSSSRGFNYTISSSWQLSGPYSLASGSSTDSELFGSSDSGLYGLDSVSLGTKSGYGPSLSGQEVTGITTENFWLGSLGLGTLPGKFSDEASSHASLLVTMKEQNLATSLSYGYTAGQSYASPRVLGSLILGGYDDARLTTGSAISTSINRNARFQQLNLSLQNIVATQLPDGSAQTLLTDPITVTVDSTTSQLWLPSNTCEYFASAFGLTLDPVTNMYLINSTMRSKLQASNPSITFTIGSGASGAITNIAFPYSAFDLNLEIPLKNYSTPYFPIRRAANESQYTLGRTFLQEAYIIVDWERSNFTIGQAASLPSSPQIVPILPPSSSAASPSGGATNLANLQPASTTGSNAGIIAGIVVALVAITAIALGSFLYYRRRRRQHRHSLHSTQGDAEDAKPEIQDNATEYSASGKKIEKTEVQVSEVFIPELEDGYNPVERARELDDTQIHELEDVLHMREAMSTPIMELEGDKVGSELDVSRAGLRGGDGAPFGSSGRKTGDEDNAALRQSKVETSGTLALYELDSAPASRVASPEPSITARPGSSRVVSSDSEISAVLSPGTGILGMLSPVSSIAQSPEPRVVHSAERVSITSMDRPAHSRTLSWESELSARVHSPVPSNLSRVQSSESLESEAAKS